MLRRMLSGLSAAGARTRILSIRALARIGLREESFLVIVAVIVGLVTAAAAVTFHWLINLIRDVLYERLGEHALYGSWIGMLIVWPALGGLLVGVISRYVFRAREGHGIVDVMESVIRSAGFVQARSALEKIVTSAITIGTGGSTGAEGPIVQIGAAISSGVASIFRLARSQMPVATACGAAAGISAIFNSPMGGLVFALEVILQDFSLRNVTPVVVASVIANVATKAIYYRVFNEDINAIFNLPASHFQFHWLQISNFIILGVLCGLAGVAITKLMYFVEGRFHHLRGNPALRPALGGGMLGMIGVVYVLIFGHWLLRASKPIPFRIYPMPAFYGDGYGFIQLLLGPDFYHSLHIHMLICLLIFLGFAKVIATCITLGSGGSGGIIAPSLFVGAVVGGTMGLLMKAIALFDPSLVQPEAYALVGMAAVLAAVVHAPLASILILLELTATPSLVLPAMLATVTATGIARWIYPESVYTAALKLRGVRFGGADINVLHRITVEQVPLDPVTALRTDMPMQELLDITARTGLSDFVVMDKDGNYAGMVVADDVQAALMDREAIPLLLVGEVTRSDVPVISHSDDLARALETFSIFEVSHLPVALSQSPNHVIGLVSRGALMRRYQQALSGN
jgi:CIC family chloride channel protein